jgi:hypothetical protein
VLIAALAAGALGCAGRPAAQTEAQPAPPPEPLEHALSGLAAQHVVVLPVYTVRTEPGFPGASAVGNRVNVERTLDADILAAFDERGLRRAWIFPPDLVETYKHNPTYAADPYGLAEEPLRIAKVGRDARLPEPFASQLRTLVAFHDDARLVLVPFELRLEPVSAHAGRGVLHLVLVDARAANVAWMGDVVSDTVPSFGPEISASLASRLANVVAIR